MKSFPIHVDFKNKRRVPVMLLEEAVPESSTPEFLLAAALLEFEIAAETMKLAAMRIQNLGGVCDALGEVQEIVQSVFSV